MSLPAVQHRLQQARALIGARHTEGVGEILDAALECVGGVAEEHKAELLTQVDELRAELAATIAAERRHRVEEELDRHLDLAEDDIRWRPADSAAALRRVRARLEDDDVRAALPAAAVAAYRIRIADIAAALA